VEPICQISTGPSGAPSTTGHSPEIRAVPPTPTVIEAGATLSGIGGAGALVVVVLEVVLVGSASSWSESLVWGSVGLGTTAGGSGTNSSSAAAGVGPAPLSMSNPHAAVAVATTTVVSPPNLITTKS
jgi:hypothetical protein